MQIIPALFVFREGTGEARQSEKNGKNCGNQCGMIDRNYGGREFKRSGKNGKNSGN